MPECLPCSKEAIASGKAVCRLRQSSSPAGVLKLRERFSRTTTALASAAHDLKTPLAILNGYVELLRSESSESERRQREVLRDMRSNGQRLQHYIQDFLTFSVLETGELK